MISRSFGLIVASLFLHSVSAAGAMTWRQAVCGATTKSPLCSMLSSTDAGTEAAALRKMKDFYLSRLEQWVTNPQSETVQDEVVRSCGMLTILSETPEGASTFIAGGDREEFDARVDACSKLVVHRVWPQEPFAKPETRDLVCNRWTPLLRELCVRAKLNG